MKAISRSGIVSITIAVAAMALASTSAVAAPSATVTVAGNPWGPADFVNTTNHDDATVYLSWYGGAWPYVYLDYVSAATELYYPYTNPGYSGSYTFLLSASDAHISSLGPGTHYILVYDGVTGVTGLPLTTRSFLVDKTPPTGSASYSLSGSTVTLSASGSDDFGLYQIHFFIDNSDVRTVNTTDRASHAQSFGVSGSHSFFARFIDKAGNIHDTTSQTFSVTVAPANVTVSGSFNAAASTINCTAVGPRYFTSLTASVDGVNRCSVNNPSWSNYTSTLSCSTTGLAFGNHTALCSAVDSGNVSASSPSIPFTLIPPPAVGDYFGGMYQVDDCGRNNVVNPYTNAASCPSGFKVQQSGRVRAPESGCGANQFVCTATASLPAPSLSRSFRFAGTYQVDDCGTNNIGNPVVAGNLGCPAGATAMAFGRIKAPEGSQCGATQYVCGYPDATPTNRPLPFWGTYEVGDCGIDSLTNWLTSAMSCPAGTSAFAYGRVQVPEGSQCGGNEYMCIRPPLSSCSDGVNDGDETGVDCGGSCALACAGTVCTAGWQCKSSVCGNGVCASASATCTNGVWDGDESDVDCGGSVCALCAIGKHCNSDDDCNSGLCGATGRCVHPPVCSPLSAAKGADQSLMPCP